jgi:protein-L-isoaspartate(D-aspartate) O-methyltransferase
MRDPTEQRAGMVRRLAEEGIEDPGTLAAMNAVPRERFAPPELARHAYAGEPIPIGAGQTISTPWIVAFMTAALGPLTTEARVLEVGTGSGYAAAVLSRCAAHVVTIERHRELAEHARQVLDALGYDNIEVRVGDGGSGAGDRAPFDGISVTAMAGEPPAPLLAQLAAGGTLICPVGGHSGGELTRIRNPAGGDAGLQRERLCPVRFVPLVPGEATG